jgi:hypothetical protein
MGGELHVRLSEEDADAERLDTLAGFVRADLRQLDVEDVTSALAGEAPPGARAFEVAAVGQLLVTLGQSAHGLPTVISALRSWLRGGSGTRRTVRMELDGDVLELSEASAADQDRLVDLFVGRHAAREGP